jgi:hypothetical protein
MRFCAQSKNANTTAQTVTVTGGTTNTYNMGAVLDDADVITGAVATTDVLAVTGAAIGSNTITAVDTINVNYATAATFTTGAITPGVASVITAAGSTAAVNLAATLYVPTTSFAITDGQVNDVITVPTTDASRNLTTVALTTGGADTINLTDAISAAGSNSTAITGFTTGIAVGSDKINLITGTQAVSGYTTITAAAQAVSKALADNHVFEINSVVGVVTDFTATADGGAVEVLLAAAVGTLTGSGATGHVVVYGGGAESGNAAIYSFIDTAANADVTTTTITQVELLATLTGVAADSAVSSNFF